MHGDLIGGCASVAAIAAGLFVLTRCAVAGLHARALNLLAILAVCALAWYIQNVWYDVRLTRWLPVSGLIVIGNWLPLFAATLAAVAWQSAEGRLRQFIVSGSLLATGALALVFPMLGEVPACGNQWDKLG